MLNGGSSLVSIARSLGRQGVRVYALMDETEPARHSRYCHWIPASVAGTTQEEWLRFLTGPKSADLRGSVLLAASDDGIELIATHREQLARRYRLDDSHPQAQLCMLNKLGTYQMAHDAGVPTPEFWLASSREVVESLEDRLRFPLMIKPLYSHLFQKRFGVKLVIVNSFSELMEQFRRVGDSDIEVMLVEMIPGPDDLLCSYYTYMNEHNQPEFDFTKRIIRRYPPVTGSGCYHITDWNPEVKALSLRLFQHVKLRGVANAEFKRDERDGQLKLIECNARFTAANCLLTRSGLDLAAFVYNRIVGGSLPRMETYKKNLRLWYPINDFNCFRRLRRQGEMTLLFWLGSVLRRQTLPLFSWLDPGPSICAAWRRIKTKVAKVAKRIAYLFRELFARPTGNGCQSAGEFNKTADRAANRL